MIPNDPNQHKPRDRKKVILRLGKYLLQHKWMVLAAVSLTITVQRTDSYVYEVVNGELKALQTQVDEDSGLLCFYAESLGYYIVSPSLMG